jgi:hypothetical protein
VTVDWVSDDDEDLGGPTAGQAMVSAAVRDKGHVP